MKWLDRFHDYLSKLLTPKTPVPIDLGTPACFHPYTLQNSTVLINVETATLPELLSALTDCYVCMATEYPETAAGFYQADAISELIVYQLRRKFPDHAQHVIAIAKKAGTEASEFHYPSRRGKSRHDQRG